MNTTVQDLQRRLIALGYNPGPADGVDGPKTKSAVRLFQIAEGLATDGIAGPVTSARLREKETKPAAAKPGQASIIPADWLPNARMKGIVLHWTGGSYVASSLDREHYHFLIEGTPKLVRGLHSVKDNETVSGKTSDHYAAHTVNCNTGFIGLSLCCMAEAKESPFNAGRAPMTLRQWELMTSAVAELSRRYSIPVTDRTVLSHAEVQNNLGIQQRGKWDFTRLAFEPSIVGAKACGDKIRAEVRAKLS